MKFFKKIINWFKEKLGQDSDPQYPIEPEVTPPIEDPVIEPGLDGIKSLKINDHGIDISHHNSSVDLIKVKTQQKFVIMKATEGASFLSSVYHKRIEEAMKLSISCGAYHYYRTNVDPIVQAKHFLKHYKGNIEPVLDLEGIGNLDYSSAKHTPQVDQFIKYIEKETGMTPILYGGFYFLRDTVKPPASWARMPLWLSWYTSDFSRVKVPAPWTKINIWQYSETAQVYGVGKCDANIFLGL